MISRLRKAFVLLVITLVASADIYAEWQFPAAPSIKTVTMGSPASLVLEKLGPPLRIVSVPPSEMGRPASQDFHYRGIIIGAYRSPDEKESHVWSVQVDGKEVVIYPGISIGMSRHELITLLGTPDSDEKREDGQWLFWTTPEPIEIFYVKLRNDRVIEFVMMEDWS